MKKNHINTECGYSFEILYEAAYGKRLDEGLKTKLQNLSQEKINSLVIKWAKIARWKTDKRIGSDGIEYVSFYE